MGRPMSTLRLLRRRFYTVANSRLMDARAHTRMCAHTEDAAGERTTEDQVLIQLELELGIFLKIYFKE